MTYVPSASDHTRTAKIYFGTPCESTGNEQRLFAQLAHQLLGRHEHVKRLLRSDLAPYAEVLANPLGYEGWASYVQDLSLGRNINALMRQRVRRLLPSTLTLATALKGKNDAQRIYRDAARIFHGFETEASTVIKHPPRLERAVALVETEDAVRAISSASKHRLCQREVHELYVAAGPLAPSNAATLSLHQFKRK